jgi:hypothetical protein
MVEMGYLPRGRDTWVGVFSRNDYFTITIMSPSRTVKFFIIRTPIKNVIATILMLDINVALMGKFLASLLRRDKFLVIHWLFIHCILNYRISNLAKNIQMVTVKTTKLVTK